MKLAVRRSALYRRVRGSTFWDVPVLPATDYLRVAALLPVPSLLATTSASILRMR